MSNTGSSTYKCILNYYNIYSKKQPKKTRIISQGICNIMLYENNIIKNVRYNTYCYNYDTIFMNINVNLEIGKKIRVSASPNKMFTQFLSNEKCCPFYTDGSKTSDGEFVGSSVYCPTLNVEEKISYSKQMSVFPAECAAISKAQEIIYDNNIKYAAIFSDSLSALQSLTSKIITVKTNPFIFSCKKMYHQILTKNPTSAPKFYWIPAHFGIFGNETADKLAKLATTDSEVYSPKVPFSDLKENFKKTMHQNVKNTLIYESTSKGKKYFEIFFKDCKYPWYSGLKLSRSHIVTINRCRANHYGLAESLHRFGIINDAHCKCDYPSEDINHVLWQCKLYDSERKVFIEKLQRIKVFLPCSADVLLSAPENSACHYMFEFLQKCQLMI